VLRKLLKFDPANELVIHVAMDNTLILSEVKAACLQPKPGTFSPCVHESARWHFAGSKVSFFIL
jgi:hypothetical protein